MLRLKRKRFSIISRLKLFSRRDEFPNSLKKLYYPIIDGKDTKDTEINIKVDQSDEFKRQYNQSTNTSRSRIDKFIKELKEKVISRFEDAGDSFADTHYLKDYSSKSDGYVMFSKKINNEDRFNYRIYLPKVMIDKETGKAVINQKIVLDTCLDHSISGKSGSYVKGQTGTIWHSPKKSRNRSKNKKDDLN